MYSLKKKLNKSLIVNMIVIMLLLLGGLNYIIQQLIKDHVRTRLQYDAESLASILYQDDSKNWQVNPEHISSIYNRVRSGHYYAVSSAKKTIRSRSLFDFEFSIPPLTDGRSLSYQMAGPGDESWLVWQQNINKKNDSLQLWVAEDISPVYQSLIHFSMVAIAMVIVATFLSIYLQQQILNRAFRVFDDLRNNLQAIRHAESDKTAALVPLEVLPLVKEIETLVEQLRLRIQRTRHAIGNLSHEIKRPLQVLSLHVDAGGDKKSVEQALNTIRGIVDRELRRARISGSNVVGGVFKIKEELFYLLEIMRKIYPHIDIQLQLQDDINELNIDRDDMLELMGNLLDNACKFARLKALFLVRIKQQKLYLCAEDDGPGVATDQLNKIVKKGLRLDETVEGHGLGLSICSDIVDSYQGQLGFSQSEMGGLKVDIYIPLALTARI